MSSILRPGFTKTSALGKRCTGQDCLQAEWTTAPDEAVLHLCINISVIRTLFNNFGRDGTHRSNFSPLGTSAYLGNCAPSFGDR